jgi:hypothetical protein
MVVVVLQPGPATVTPAAPPSAPTLAPVTTTVPAGPTAGTGPPLDPAFLEPSYLDQVASSIALLPQDEAGRVGEEATQLEAAWGLEFYPAAKAVVIKADLLGIEIDPTDPTGDDALVSRFEAAGYTDADAAALADAWSTDTHTAKVMGALLVAAG